MGNLKSVLHGPEVADNRRRSLRNMVEPTKLAKVVEQPKHSGLSEKDVAFLCSQTGLSPSEVNSWHKKFFHENPSGHLDRIAFRKLYRLLRNESPERLNNMCDHVFRAFDVDGNGYVEFGEFLLGFAVSSHGDLRARLDYAFEFYDIDSNGYLTEHEIESVLQSVYILLGIQHIEDYPPQAVAKDLMKKSDVSNDGRISKDEFINFLMKDGIYRNTINPFH